MTSFIVSFIRSAPSQLPTTLFRKVPEQAQSLKRGFGTDIKSNGIFISTPNCFRNAAKKVSNLLGKNYAQVYKAGGERKSSKRT